MTLPNGSTPKAFPHKPEKYLGLALDLVFKNASVLLGRSSRRYRWTLVERSSRSTHHSRHLRAYICATLWTSLLHRVNRSAWLPLRSRKARFMLTPHPSLRRDRACVPPAYQGKVVLRVDGDHSRDRYTTTVYYGILRYTTTGNTSCWGLSSPSSASRPYGSQATKWSSGSTTQARSEASLRDTPACQTVRASSTSFTSRSRSSGLRHYGSTMYHPRATQRTRRPAFTK